MKFWKSVCIGNYPQIVNMFEHYPDDIRNGLNFVWMPFQFSQLHLEYNEFHLIGRAVSCAVRCISSFPLLSDTSKRSLYLYIADRLCVGPMEGVFNVRLPKYQDKFDGTLPLTSFAYFDYSTRKWLTLWGTTL